ncbi:MAG: MFS transporter [Chloroflexota bacterium]|nr:MFS transporter [Chloroflexota bacterium]
MVGAEVRRYASDRRGLALNVFLGIGGGFFGSLAETMLLPTLVLAFFVAPLTGSYATVGLVPAIGIGVWLLARLPAAILVNSRRRKLPWAIGASLIKAAALALLAAVCFRADQTSTEPLLRSFFICYVAYSLASGFGSVPVAAVISKAVPHEARGMFFQQRALWGGLSGLVAGLVVVQLLGPAAPAFPQNFGVLFLAATVTQLAATFFLATIREPLRIAEPQTSLPAQALRGTPEALADPNFRRFLLFRLFLSSSAIVDPFLIIFAASALGVPSSAVGWYVIAFVAGRVLSLPFWAALAHRHGERACLQVAALVRLVPPLLALMLPILASSSRLNERIGNAATLQAVFGVAYLALGMSLAGQSRGNYGYLAEAAPDRSRAAYAALTNALLAVVAFTPIAGGMLIERRGYDALLLTATGLGLLAVFASGALTDTHVRTRPTAQAWRLRRGGGNGRERAVSRTRF